MGYLKHVKIKSVKLSSSILTLFAYLFFSNTCVVNALIPSHPYQDFNSEIQSQKTHDADDHENHNSQHDDQDDEHAPHSHSVSDHHNSCSAHSRQDGSSEERRSCCSQFLQDFPVVICAPQNLVSPTTPRQNQIAFTPIEVFTHYQSPFFQPNHGPPKGTLSDSCLFYTPHLRAPPFC